MRKSTRVGLCGVLALASSGCDFSASSLPSWTPSWVSSWLKGGAPVVAATGPTGQSGPSGEPGLSPAAEAARQHAELLREMHWVVYGAEPKSRAEFGDLVDTLNQGASLEGIHNGFTHSARFREMEEENRGASVAALRIFSEELALLEAELPTPTEFSESAAMPLAMAVTPSAEPGAGTPGPMAAAPVEGAEKETPEQQEARRKALVAALTEKYSKLFVAASIFTLKRVVSDEAQKVVDSKKQYREKVALWYSKWVARMATRGVDFGLPLRNSADEGLHYKWAIGASDDRLVWEVLNRLHRVLNDANRNKQ